MSKFNLARLKYTYLDKDFNMINKEGADILSKADFPCLKILKLCKFLLIQPTIKSEMMASNVSAMLLGRK